MAFLYFDPQSEELKITTNFLHCISMLVNDMKLKMAREIPYQKATMYYFVY